MLGMNRTAIPPAADPAAQKFLLLVSLSQTSCKYLVACLYSITINTPFGFSSARQYFFRRTKQVPAYAEQHTAFQDTLCQRIAGNTGNVRKRKKPGGRVKSSGLRYQYVMSLIKTKNPNAFPIGNKFGFFMYGGGRWIRTTESTANRFTVCPLWPLGNSPIFGLPVSEALWSR